MLLQVMNVKLFAWTLLLTYQGFLQTCQCNQPLPCVWRIILPWSDVGAGFISTNTPFQVSYLDTSCAQELEWEATGGCRVQNDSSLDTSVTCRLPGYHMITPIIKQSCNLCVPVGKTVAVWNNPLCYRWYAASVHKVPIWSDRDTSYGQWTLDILRVWVVDWTKADEDERNGNATIPSQFSVDLARKFHIKGQRPMVKQAHPTSQQQLHVDNITFNQDLGYWEIHVQFPVYTELELTIAGRLEIAAHSCFIGDTSVLQTNHWLSPSDKGETTQLHYAPGYPTRLVQDPCASHSAILLSQNSLLLTMDGFMTSVNLSLPIHLVQDLSPEVESVAFTPTHLLLLINSKVFGLHRTLDNFTQVTGLAGQSAVRGIDWCIPPTLHRRHLAVSFNTTSLFLISTLSLTDHRLISQEIPLTPSIFHVLGFTADLAVEIQDVAFDSFSNKLGLVVMVTENSHSAFVFLQYDITLASWTALPFWLDARDTYGSISILFTHGAYDASFLFWDQKRLYFSRHDGQYGVLVMTESDSVMLNATSNEVIKQVSVSQSGDILVMMSSNRLYYSRVGLLTLVSLPASELPTTPSNIIFDSLGNLFIVRSEDHCFSSVGCLRWRYPLDVEVAGTLHNSQNSCPYKRFEHADTAGIYYLDIGDVVHLWTLLTFPSDADVNLKVAASSSNLLHIGEEDLWAYHPGWLSVNKTLTIQPNPSLQEPDAELAQFTGGVVVEVSVDQDDVSCLKPTSMVARFIVGCPPGRHIRVRKPDICLHFSNYTVPRDAYLENNGSTPENSKVVEYDWSTYACPLTSHYQQPFRPSLDLYDHGDFVSELSSNYVIFEEQGRVDYSYNASMLQAGCHSVTPTQSLVTNSSDAIIASESYQSCFILNGTKDLTGLRKQRYSVLNRTGVTSIVWTTGKNNSIYQFTATIIDPRYSFCRLQAKFAVMVYGHSAEVQEKPVTQVSLGTFALLTFALGVISYMYFRKGHVKKLEQQLSDYDTGQ